MDLSTALGCGDLGACTQGCPLPCRYMVDAADQEKIEASKNELHNLLDKPQLQGIPVSCCLDRSPTSYSRSPGWWLPGFAARGLHFVEQIQGGIPLLGGVHFPAALLQALGQ